MEQNPDPPPTGPAETNSATHVVSNYSLRIIYKIPILCFSKVKLDSDKLLEVSCLRQLSAIPSALFFLCLLHKAEHNLPMCNESEGSAHFVRAWGLRHPYCQQIAR